MATLKEWIMRHFESEASLQPFSFEYGSKASREFLKTWEIESISKELDEYLVQHEFIYTDPEKCLKIH